MARKLALVATLLASASGFVLPDHLSTPHQPSSAHKIKALSRKDDISSSNSPVQQQIDFTTRLPSRHILVGDGSGFTITCIDCSIEGKFQLDADIDIDEAVVSEIAILASSVAAVASTVASDVTSVVTVAASAFTSLNSQAVAGATSIESKASSVLSGIEASATPFVQSLTSDVGGFFTSLFPRMPGSGTRPLAVRQSPQALAALNNFNMSLTQMAPIKASFNLEFATNNDSITLPFGAPAALPGVLPISFPGLPVGRVNVGLVLKPLGLSFSATLQPNMNVTLPFGADIAFERSLVITETGIQDANPNVTLHSNPPVLNQFDPSLCLSAGIGPILTLAIDIPEADIKITFEAQLNLPKINLCLSELHDVNAQCQPTGSIRNAFHVSENVSIGISSSFRVELPVGLEKLLPSPPQIPDLMKDFNVLDRCIDTDQKDALPTNGPVAIGFNISQSISDVVLTSINVAQSTSGGGASNTQGNVRSEDSSSPLVTEIQPTISIVEPPTIQSATVTVTIASDTPNQLSPAEGKPFSVTVTNFDEPFGIVFSLPTHLVVAEKQF